MTDDPIDAATFAELQDTAGAEFVGELVGTFLEEAPQMIAWSHDAVQLIKRLHGQNPALYDGFGHVDSGLMSLVAPDGALDLYHGALRVRDADGTVRVYLQGGGHVVVDVFGTWCPNCNDQAPVLASWDRKYRSRGLAIVGQAFVVACAEEAGGQGRWGVGHVRGHPDSNAEGPA